MGRFQCCFKFIYFSQNNHDLRRVRQCYFWIIQQCYKIRIFYQKLTRRWEKLPCIFYSAFRFSIYAICPYMGHFVIIVRRNRSNQIHKSLINFEYKLIFLFFFNWQLKGRPHFFFHFFSFTAKSMISRGFLVILKTHVYLQKIVAKFK